MKRDLSATDCKEHLIIERLHAAILSGTFGEREIFELLIILRDHAEEGSLVREFGNFVAHRERSRGKLQTIVQHVQSVLDGSVTLSANSGEAIFTATNIQESLNETFLSLHLPRIEEEQGNQITLCIISLLQSARVEIEAQSMMLDFELSIGVSRRYLYLLGEGQLPAGHSIRFPLLVARNVCFPSDWEYPPMPLNDTIEIGFVDGKCRSNFPKQPA